MINAEANGTGWDEREHPSMADLVRYPTPTVPPPSTWSIGMGRRGSKVNGASVDDNGLAGCQYGADDGCKGNGDSRHVVRLTSSGGGKQLGATDES